MDRILVVGGAGYIGSHTVAYLQEINYEVVVVDNLAAGHRESIGDTPFYGHDLANAAAMDQVFSQAGPFTGVIHFAAFAEVGQSVTDPLAYYQNNVANTILLLQLMVKHNCPYIIFSSSAAVYGEPKSVPIDEHHSTRPINPYGLSKLMVENIFQDCQRAYGLRYCALRYFNAAGAHPHKYIGEDHNPETHLIPLVLQAAIAKKHGTDNIPQLKIFGTDYHTEDGTCVRDYIHVCDLATAHVLALEYLKKGSPSDIFNIGNGDGYSVRQVIQTAEQVSQVSIPFVESTRRPGDPATLVASSEKIRRRLGWQPQYPSLHDIVCHAWNWHSNYPQGFGKS